MTVNATTGIHVAAADIVDLTAADLDTDVALAANSDTKVASQKAAKAYADTKVSKAPAAAQTITGGHSLTNTGGFIGPLTGDVQETVPAAKTTSAAIAEKQGLVRLGSAGSLAMTLADPTNGTDDGKRLTIMASTAHAHVITVTGGLAGGASNTITLGGAIGDMAELEAIGGKWFLRPSINATKSTV
jgi:hypothetical protein